ncbi:acylphosphatase [Atopococcus tabaci]|uniref:acylphosphatase n=1 Tax=Atopococcus tabaci TaxID=269774 RepID=UPI000418E877
MVSFFERLLGKNTSSSQELAPFEYKNKGATEEEHKKIKMMVTGHVQGVGFRYSTKQAADSIGVAGIVRNEMDGSVYIEAVGPEEKIEQFIHAIRQSPSPSARIDQLVVEEDPSIEDYANFSVSN